MKEKNAAFGRLRFMRLGALVLGLIIIAQLFRVQVLSHGFYAALAGGQHDILRQLFPERGKIYARDTRSVDQAYLLATNQKLTLVYAEPFRIEDPSGVAARLASLLEIEEEELKAKLSNSEERYRPLKSKVTDDIKAQIVSLDLQGIRFADETHRFYPEGSSGAQVVGFLGATEHDGRVGRYGTEGYFEEELAGEQGYLRSEKDSGGRVIVVGNRSVEKAQNGSDIILTIDRTVQHVVCGQLEEWIKRHEAERGSVVVLDPETGAIMAMCNAPIFDPNEYNLVEDIGIYNNTAIFDAYEPGSVFKAVTMAAGLDLEKVDPSDEFKDEGEVKIGPHTIRNSDLKAHGLVTMTDVLTESLNTGMVEVVSRIGSVAFLKYVRDFGFGEKTGVNLQTEMAGNIEPLTRRGDIWSATGSYGQGLTVTLLQLAAAYGAIANDGILMKPYIVDEIRHADDTIDARASKKIRRVISERASRLLSGMLVSVIERGHGRSAGVKGYWMAGKTGTAQIPKKEGSGYELHDTIGSFIGFGPIDDPKFVIAVRVDRPQTVRFAESSAAPLFGDIAAFLLNYYEIPPTRK